MHVYVIHSLIGVSFECPYQHPPWSPVSIGKPAPKIHQWTIYFCRWGFGWVDKAQCFRSARRFGAAGSSPDFSRGFSRHGTSRPLSWTFFRRLSDAFVLWHAFHQQAILMVQMNAARSSLTTTIDASELRDLFLYLTFPKWRTAARTRNMNRCSSEVIPTVVMALRISLKSSASSTPSISGQFPPRRNSKCPHGAAEDIGEEIKQDRGQNYADKGARFHGNATQDKNKRLSTVYLSESIIWDIDKNCIASTLPLAAYAIVAKNNEQVSCGGKCSLARARGCKHDQPEAFVWNSLLQYRTCCDCFFF